MTQGLKLALSLQEGEGEYDSGSGLAEEEDGMGGNLSGSEESDDDSFYSPAHFTPLLCGADFSGPIRTYYRTLQLQVRSHQAIGGGHYI